MNKKFMLAIFYLRKKRSKRQLTFFIIVLLFLFFSSTVAFAKVLNIGTPSDSVYVQGNLGVGTASPGAKLDVVGGISASPFVKSFTVGGDINTFYPIIW